MIDTFYIPSLLKESGSIGPGLPPASPTESCTSDVSASDKY